MSAEPEKPIVTAIRLLRKYDRSIAWYQGKEVSKELADDLMSILQSLFSRPDSEVPLSVKADVMKSLVAATNKLDEKLAEVEIPDMEDYLARLQAVGADVREPRRRLKAIKELSQRLDEAHRGIEGQKAMDKMYATSQEVVDELTKMTKEVQSQTLDLWTYIVTLEQTVLGVMERFVPPTSREVARAFTGEP